VSRTYELVCHDCEVALGVGQGWPEKRQYIYKTVAHLDALETFLFTHQRHRIEFGDDEHMDLDYTAIEVIDWQEGVDL
jgi:hypothetical protein